MEIKKTQAFFDWLYGKVKNVNHISCNERYDEVVNRLHNIDEYTLQNYNIDREA